MTRRTKDQRQPRRAARVQRKQMKRKSTAKAERGDRNAHKQDKRVRARLKKRTERNPVVLAILRAMGQARGGTK